MKHLFPATLLTGALLCAVAFAQSTSPSAQSPGTPTQQPEAQPQAQQPSQATQTPASAPAAATQEPSSATPRIASGSVIPVQLTKTIDAKKAKPGDEVVAKVTMDMKTTSGEVVVPKDTKVVGHVTEAQARSKEQKESQLGIAFDRAMLKGSEMSLPMSIQAVIAPPSNSPNSNGGSPDQSAPPSGGPNGWTKRLLRQFGSNSTLKYSAEHHADTKYKRFAARWRAPAHHREHAGCRWYLESEAGTRTQCNAGLSFEFGEK